MKQFSTVAVVITALVSLSATPSSAVVKIARFSGTISNGFDQTGVFGVAGASLAGLSYVLTYTYDKSLGSVFTTDGVSYELSSSLSQPGLFGRGPIIRSSFTVNGRSAKVVSLYNNRAYAGINGAGQTTIDQYNVGTIRTFNYLDVYTNNASGLPPFLDTDVAPILLSGEGAWIRKVSDSATDDTLSSSYAYFDGQMLFSVSDVPEPVTWSLMVVGFGFTGAVLRRQKVTKFA